MISHFLTKSARTETMCTTLTPLMRVLKTLRRNADLKNGLCRTCQRGGPVQDGRVRQRRRKAHSRQLKKAFGAVQRSGMAAISRDEHASPSPQMRTKDRLTEALPHVYSQPMLNVASNSASKTGPDRANGTAEM